MRNRKRIPSGKRGERREAKRKLKKEIAEFLKIQNHYFPDLLRDIKNVLDARHQSYIEYQIEVILYIVILKNVCSIVSMQEMSYQFDEDECIRNIYKILGLEEKDMIPHYVTINECLSKLDVAELEKIRKKMIVGLIRRKSFNNAKFQGLYWNIIVDGTQLFAFKERHCEHCLTKTMNKGKENEYTIYYHQVLEAKLILGENIVVSIATEFIENSNENPTKQDCELNAFKRLAEALKKMFPRLPICILADSLYASKTVFDICMKNEWAYLIRYKDGKIPSLAKEFHEKKETEDGETETVPIEEINKRKPNVSTRHKIRWVNGLNYQGHNLTVMELEIERDDNKPSKHFQWVTNLAITASTAHEFANTGRKRWMIENEGFNIQKNTRYFITHANSLDYNAMKNHYLLTQLADMILQMYENGVEGLRILKKTIANISEGLLESLRKQSITNDDLKFERMQIRKLSG